MPTTTFPAGTPVTFRPEFSVALVGIEFTVDDMECGMDPNGNQMIALKRKVSGRWGYRLAYVKDLVQA
jgi:hypothetical protein